MRLHLIAWGTYILAWLALVGAVYTINYVYLLSSACYFVAFGFWYSAALKHDARLQVRERND